MPTLFGARGMYRTSAVLLALSLGGLMQDGAHAATFRVTHFWEGPEAPNDFGDANPGDGVAETLPGSGIASFRTCLEEARAHEGPDTILIPHVAVCSDCAVVVPPVEIRPLTPYPPLDDETGGITITSPNREFVRFIGSELPDTSQTPGLVLTSAGNIVENISIYEFPGDAIQVVETADPEAPASFHATGNIIQDCMIGFTQFGCCEFVEGGNGRAGVAILGGATGTLVTNCLIGKNGVGGDATIDAEEAGVLIDGDGTSGNQVVGCFIGLAADGCPAPPDATFVNPVGNVFSGVTIQNGAAGNTIGGPGSGEKNYISANGQGTAGMGVLIKDPGTDNNLVQGNVIGLNQMEYKEGSPTDGCTVGEPRFEEAGNGFAGVVIKDGASANLIGGSTAETRNLISDHSVGVLLEGVGTDRNIVRGNWLGLDKTGVPLPAFGCSLRGCNGAITYFHMAVGNNIGIVVSEASNTVLGGAGENEGNLVVGSGNRGILVGGEGGFSADQLTVGTVIQGNFVGVLPSGGRVGNGFSGIALAEGATDTLVGGPAEGARNTIGANTNDGIVIYGSGTLPTSRNTVQNNFVSNNTIMGVFILRGAFDNQIGGTGANEGNVLVSNGRDGVRVANIGSTGNVVQGNLIGVTEDGTAAGNAQFGVNMIEGATDNLIGGTAAGAGNVIVNCGLSGVDISGTQTIHNQIRANVIYKNTGAGIIHTFNGNENYPAPTVDGIGPLRGTAEPFDQVEVFSDTEDEGEMFVGRATANALGNWTIDLPDLAVHSGRNLTATATSTLGNTSPFSDTLYIEAPSIAQQPTEVLVVEGDPFQISMQAAGTPTLLYQWQFSPDGSEGTFVDIPFGGNFSGTNAPILLNSASVIDDRGVYRCVVSNAVASTPTNGVRVQVVGVGLNTAAVNTLSDVVDGNTNSFAHVITFPGEDGKVSLRELMLAANNMTGENTINFGITGTIFLTSGLPALTDTTGPTTIDGNNGITVDGGTLEGDIDGFTIPTWDNVLTGLDIVGMPSNGISIEGANATGNVIVNCRVGNDGLNEHPNGASGIVLRNGAHGNTIGGVSDGDANVLSGNVLYGIQIRDAGTDDNLILGNYIGTDAVATAAVPNGVDGIRVERGAVDTVIGGVFAGARNVISGNAQSGVTISGAGTAGTRILGNYIGTDVTGDNPVGNGEHGIFAVDGSEDSLIGGTQPGAANVLSGNGRNGVRISGAATMHHRIRRNSIFLNGDSGILLEDGANEGMPAPRITELGSVRGTAEPNAVIDLFINPTDTDEAKTLLGSATANGSGAFFFDVDLTAYVTMTLTATATDAAGNTSALSSPKVVDLDPPVITINGDPLMEIECSVGIYNEPGAGALDDVDGDISGYVRITVTRDGVTVPAVDTTTPGTYIVSYNVTDISGKPAETAIRTVRVQDTIPPELSLLGSNSLLLECASEYNDAGASAFDICAGDITAAIVVSNPVDTGSPGIYTVSYAVSDAAGNLAAAVSRTVRVLDRVAPAIVLEGANPLTMTVFTSYNEPGVSATDACDEALPPVTTDTSGLNTSRPGTYTVSYHVSDASGNTDTATRTVIVRDDVRPELTLNGSASVLLDCGEDYEELGAAALDNLDGDISNQVQISGTVDSHATGVYTLRYDVTDNAGNVAAPVTRVVEVRDNSEPEITLLGGATINQACNSAYDEPGFIAEDACDGDLTDVVSVQNPVDTATPGRYNVRYTVTDANGNRAQAVRTVIVLDCPGNCVAQCEDAADQTDSDHDTLNACAEECLGTSDQSIDTDLDGLPDPYEVTAGTNPVVPDADVDLDGDGLDNLEEYLRNGQPDNVNSPEFTVFVAPDEGKGGGDGSQDNPFAAISEALAGINPTASAPVRVVLAPGVYIENVTLLPWVTLAGSLEGEVRIEGEIVGAQGAALEHLTLVAFTEDDLLLLMNDVRMRVSHVWFVGGAPLPAIGIAAMGDRAGESVIEDCVFALIGTGIDISGAVPTIRRCFFQDLSNVGILFRETADIEGSGPVGEEGAFVSGWNIFDTADTGSAVVNLSSQTAIMEQNDWGTDDEGGIAAQIDGPGEVDFRPFLPAGTGANVATLHVVLLAEGTTNRLGGGSVTLEESGFTALAERNVYNFPVIAAGVHTISAEAPRFQSLTTTVFVENGGNSAITLALKAVPKRGPFRCGGEAPAGGGLGGDVLIMLLISGVLFWQTARLTRRSRQSL